MTGFSAIPLAQEQGNDHDDHQKFRGISRIIGPQWAHLPTLTVGLLGVQIFWSVEMSYASPYLLSLGISKSHMAVVFVAGPLSGLIMQPLIGVLADNSTSRFGRRRPYMLLGTCLCMLAMLLLGYTRPIASIFTGWDNNANDILTIWLAVLSIYLIDFSINAVQAMDRSLLVDTLPSSAQSRGNAWAARMLGIGSVVGFFVGNINLPRYLPFLGQSQLEVLSVIVSLLLLAGHLIMAVLVKERVLLAPNNSSKSQRKSMFGEIKAIWTNMRLMPRVIRQICIIQFFAWLGWFPVLFYSTIYVGDLHKRISPMPTSDEEQILLDAEATRLGSRALFYSSLLSLFANIVLPYFVAEASNGTEAGIKLSNGVRGEKVGEKHRWLSLIKVPRVLQVHLASLWAVSHLVFGACMLATFFTQSVHGATTLVTITGFSWAITQWAPFSLLAEAILTEPGPASLDDASSIRLADTRTSQIRSRTSGDGERDVFLLGHDGDSDNEEIDEQDKEDHRRVLTNLGAQVSRINVSGGVDDEDDYEVVGRGGEGREGVHDMPRENGGGLSAMAGVILGIHNVFIVIPQFLVTGLSSIIFAIFDPVKSVLPAHHPGAAGPAISNGTVLLSDSISGSNSAADGTVVLRDLVIRGMEMLTRDDGGNEEGPGAGLAQEEGEGKSDSVVYIFRIGGVAAIIAFVLCWRLARELRHR